MSDARSYIEYVELGADAVGVGGVRKALAFASAEPAAALRIRRESERQKREAEERNAYIAAYVLQGGDTEQASAAYAQQADDERARRTAEAVEEAHLADLRRTRGSF
jgi:hypothetical protein